MEKWPLGHAIACSVFFRIVADFMETMGLFRSGDDVIGHVTSGFAWWSCSNCFFVHIRLNFTILSTHAAWNLTSDSDSGTSGFVDDAMFYDIIGPVAEWRYRSSILCSVVRRLTPLLRGIGRVVSKRQDWTSPWCKGFRVCVRLARRVCGFELWVDWQRDGVLFQSVSQRSYLSTCRLSRQFYLRLRGRL